MNDTNGKVNWTIIGAFSGVALTVLTGGYFFVQSKTQTEVTQIYAANALLELTKHLDSQVAAMTDLINRITRIEASNEYIRQSINELKLTVEAEKVQQQELQQKQFRQRQPY